MFDFEIDSDVFDSEDECLGIFDEVNSAGELRWDSIFALSSKTTVSKI